MRVHRVKSVVSLFERSGLLVTDQVARAFNDFLQHYPKRNVHNTQLDYPEWCSRILMPDDIRQFNHEAQLKFAVNREPMMRFAFDVYMEFFKTNQLSLAAQVKQQLFSGPYRQYYFRITRNNFPYHMHKDLQHHVVWMNPNLVLDDDQSQQIIDHVQRYFQSKRCYCLLFQNRPNQRSIPEVTHYQLFVYEHK